MSIKLFGSPRSPYVRKVRIVLEEKNIAYELILERTHLAQSNPLGKVPTLVLDDGKSLYDSPVIVEYLEGIASHPQLIPKEFVERIEVKRWEALADGVADATVNISHERRKPQAQQETQEWYDKQRKKIDQALAVMSRDLGERKFCHGEHFGLADIAAGFCLGYIDLVTPEIEWRSLHRNLERLTDSLSQRPSFKKTALAS